MSETTKVQVNDCPDIEIDFTDQQKETLRRIIREELYEILGNPKKATINKTNVCNVTFPKESNIPKDLR